MTKVIALVGLLMAAEVHADPAAFKQHLKAGLELGNQGKWAEAQAELEAATQEQSDPRAWAELGWAALQAGDITKARAASARAADEARDPKLRATALLNLGLAEAKDNQPGLARRSFEASLALHPNKVAQQELANVAGAEVTDACYDTLSQALPARDGSLRDKTGSVRLATITYFCDTTDRIAVAKVLEGKPHALAPHGAASQVTGQLVVMDRMTGAVVSSAAGGRCVDDCWPEGHAGCSEMSGCTITSKIRGAKVLKVWSEDRFLGDVDDADKAPTCGPFVRGRGLMRCSTEHYVAIVDSESCSAHGTHLLVELYDATQALSWASKPMRRVDGDRDFSTQTPTFTFGDIKLAVGDAGLPSTLTVDGKTETCLALSL